MKQPVSDVPVVGGAPRFYVTQRQPLRPAALVLAVVCAAAAMYVVTSALKHNGHIQFGEEKDAVSRSMAPGAAAESPQTDDEDDDPSQIDTIVLGDPADPPVPARKGNHVSPVHPTILVKLPRYGSQSGLIPDSAAGHQLYKWMAAFNQGSDVALAAALPGFAMDGVVEAQMEIRRQTGGFALLSAKEAAPGVMVFRLQSQTQPPYEVLGTLRVGDAGEVVSFGLGAVGPKKAKTAGEAPHS